MRKREKVSHVAGVAAALALLPAAPAIGGAYVTGSVSAATTSAPMQTNQSQFGSASLEFDVGSQLRVGYTYGLEQSSVKGWKDPGAASTVATTDPSYCASAASCDAIYTNSTVIQHSLGATLILYQGQIFSPFVMGGAMLKIMTVQARDVDPKTGHLVDTSSSTPLPGPYFGFGLGIQLNRDFTLKLSDQFSPGYQRVPGQVVTKKVWDAQSTVGISYKL